MYLDINDFIFKGQILILTLKAYFKVHQVPLRNFKEIPPSFSWIQMVTTDLLKVSCCFKLVKIMGPELDFLG